MLKQQSACCTGQAQFVTMKQLLHYLILLGKNIHKTICYISHWVIPDHDVTLTTATVSYCSAIPSKDSYPGAYSAPVTYLHLY